MAELNKWVTVTPKKTAWWYLMMLCNKTKVKLRFLGVKPMYVLYTDGKKYRSLYFNFKTMEVS